MSKRWVKYFVLLLALGLAFYVGILVGFRLGTDFGIADYHNQRMRPIQAHLNTLVRHLEAEEFTQATSLALQIQGLAAAASDPGEFYGLLNSALGEEAETTSW